MVSKRNHPPSLYFVDDPRIAKRNIPPFFYLPAFSALLGCWTTLSHVCISLSHAACLACLVLSLRCVCLLKLKSGDLDFHHHHGPSLPRATPVFFVWNRPACLLAYSAPSPPFYIDRSPFLPPIGLPPKFRLLIFDTFLLTAASKPISSSCVTLVHDFRRRHRPPLHSYLQTTNIIV